MTETLPLTVVLPVFNGQDTIRACLESVFSGPSTGMECIVVNDGSDDATDAVVRRFCRAHREAPVRLVMQENCGVSVARNRGLAEAKGRYVMFVDADDLLEKGWASRVAQAVRSDSHSDVLIFTQASAKRHLSVDDCLRVCLGDVNGVPGAIRTALQCPFSKLYRREFLESQSIQFPPDVRTGEDALFNAAVFVAGAQVSFEQHSIYLYRKNMASVTNRPDSDYCANDVAFHRHLKKLLLRSNFSADERSLMVGLSYLGGLLSVVAKSDLSRMDGGLSGLLSDWEDYESALSRLNELEGYFSPVQRQALWLMRKGRFVLAHRILDCTKLVKRIAYSISGGYRIERV